jgi:hypothetical protein
MPGLTLRRDFQDLTRASLSSVQDLDTYAANCIRECTILAYSDYVIFIIKSV